MKALDLPPTNPEDSRLFLDPKLPPPPNPPSFLDPNDDPPLNPPVDPPPNPPPLLLLLLSLDLFPNPSPPPNPPRDPKLLPPELLPDFPNPLAWPPGLFTESPAMSLDTSLSFPFTVNPARSTPRPKPRPIPPVKSIVSQGLQLQNIILSAYTTGKAYLSTEIFKDKPEASEDEEAPLPNLQHPTSKQFKQ